MPVVYVFRQKAVCLFISEKVQDESFEGRGRSGRGHAYIKIIIIFVGIGRIVKDVGVVRS